MVESLENRDPLNCRERPSLQPRPPHDTVEMCRTPAIRSDQEIGRGDRFSAGLASSPSGLYVNRSKERDPCPWNVGSRRSTRGARPLSARPLPPPRRAREPVRPVDRPDGHRVESQRDTRNVGIDGGIRNPGITGQIVGDERIRGVECPRFGRRQQVRISTRSSRRGPRRLDNMPGGCFSLIFHPRETYINML